MKQTDLLNIFINILSIFDVEAMIRYGGLFLLFLLIYGSTGLFFCFFLPSGALLFAAGVLAATGDLHNNIFTVCILLILASVLGNITGYWFGWKTGPGLYKRKDSGFFRRRHLTAAEMFYKKYGWLTLTMGCFLPVIRTFAPVVAGMIRMNFRWFFLLVFAGSFFWILSFVLAGYFIGTDPFLKHQLKYIVVGFILIVTVPLVFKIINELRKSQKKNKSLGDKT